MATQSKLTPIDQLRNAVMEARAYSDRLFQIVREDSLYERPIPERHRIIFYIGHLEAFDWNLFRTHLFSLESRTHALDGGFFPLASKPDGFSPETLLRAVYEHRLMHAETLAYMFHRLPYSHKHPQSQDSYSSAPVENEMVDVHAGKATLGLSRGPSAPFGWDNEFGSFTSIVPDFRIDKYMVTN